MGGLQPRLLVIGYGLSGIAIRVAVSGVRCAVGGGFWVMGCGEAVGGERHGGKGRGGEGETMHVEQGR